MSQKLRWGILGVAGINDRLMPAFQASRTVELKGIASRSLEKAQASATKNGIPLAFGSYDALLADPDIDAVYNPLPNHMHDEWTRKAADAGKHILCEKPLTCDAASAEKLVAYCRGKGVRLMDGSCGRTTRGRTSSASSSIPGRSATSRRSSPGSPSTSRACRPATSACSRRPAAAGCWTWAVTPPTRSAGG